MFQHRMDWFYDQSDFHSSTFVNCGFLWAAMQKVCAFLFGRDKTMIKRNGSHVVCFSVNIVDKKIFCRFYRIKRIALILSYSRSDQSSAIIAELPKEKQIMVVERIAKMGRTSPDVIKIVESNLSSKFASIICLWLKKSR